MLGPSSTATSMLLRCKEDLTAKNLTIDRGNHGSVGLLLWPCCPARIDS